jgi:hypothetical protein
VQHVNDGYKQIIVLSLWSSCHAFPKLDCHCTYKIGLQHTFSSKIIMFDQYFCHGCNLNLYLQHAFACQSNSRQQQGVDTLDQFRPAALGTIS